MSKATEARATDKIIEIEVSQIKATENGERTKDVATLAKSIAAVGLMVPLIVQPVPDEFKNGKQIYKLVDGHRRLAAVKSNKAASVRAIEIDPFTTPEKMGVLQLTANVHRLQLTPFQEAEAIAKLRKAGRTPQEIAADLGMTPQAVARRDQLNKLIPEWLNYVSKIREGQSLSVAAFEMIASYEPSVQGKLLSGYQKSSHVPTVEDVKHELAAFDRQLKSAPWKLDDALLMPTAGACTTCQKRSSCQSLLFDGETSGKKAKPDDRCLDIACWNKKMEKYGKQKLEAAQAKYPNLVLLNTANGWDDKRVVGGLSRGNTVITANRWSSDKGYEAAKKGDKDAVPAMTINEKGLGSIGYIKITKKAEPAKPTKAAAKKLTPEEQAKAAADELEARREGWIKDRIEHGFEYGSKAPQRVQAMHAEELLLLLGTLCQCSSDMDYERFENWRKRDRSKAIDAIWHGIIEYLWLPDDWFQLLTVAEHVLGLDAKTLEAEALKAIPDPKPKAGATVIKTAKKGKK